MSRLLYTSLYLAATPLIAPWLGWRYFVKGKYRESLPKMLGLGDAGPAPNPGDRERTLWFHAVSVGEVNAAAAMIRVFRERFPDARVIASTTTETGQAHARRALEGMADDVFYYPFDFPWVVGRALDRAGPTDLVLLETEIWPNMLEIAARRGVRLWMMNGKLSEGSFRNYSRFRALFRGPLSGVRAFCMQTEIDGERMRSLCGRPEAVSVTGNCKFDSPMRELDSDARAELRAEWRIAPERPLVVVGSTHEGEERIVAEAYRTAREAIPDVAFVVAPRHPERFDAAAKVFEEFGLATRRVSRPDTGPERPEIVLLDAMGALQRAYGAGAVAVVAGSFAPIGGHNLLEAAVHGVPVVHGPEMRNQRELTRLFDAHGGAVKTGADQLGATLVELLTQPDRAAEIGAQARETWARNRGAAHRNLEIYLSSL